jgi:hypothetical protein
MTDVYYPDVHVKLTGKDSNVFHTIADVAAALRRAGHAQAAEDFANAAMDSDSYDEVLRLAMRTVEVS